VLSFSQAFDAYSYFRVSTNAINGTSLYYSGDTLSVGGESIDAIGTTAAVSDVGTEQFGLAIDDTEASHSFAELAATAPYNNGDGVITDAGDAEFAFDTASTTTPVEIASATQPIVCDTGAVRYLGNISTVTTPGIYTTTLTYLVTPRY
jgi:hypothetical protein